jgi:hypothetical protein
MTKRKTLSPRQRDAAHLLTEGLPPAVVAEQLKCARTTIYRWLTEPLFIAEQQRARAAYTARAESELAAARPSAVRALRAIVERGERGDDSVSTGDLTKAALGLLSASQTPSEAMRQRALTDLLKRLPSTLRANVVEALTGEDRVTLAALSDAELEALTGERITGGGS